MGAQKNCSAIGQVFFNTLAQSGTAKQAKSNGKRTITVKGKGTDVTNFIGLKGWAERKTITQTLMLKLIDVAKSKGRFDQVRAYWNTYRCLNQVYSSGDRLYGEYCKNKFCTVCLCIRKAEIINRYMLILSKWEKPFLVTLTIKAVPAYKLKMIMNKMVQGFQRIKNKYRKRHQRGKGIKLIGIKSLESNFNPIALTYNPHFHILVPNEEIADILRREWQILWKGKWTYHKAQDKRKVIDLHKDLMECVKYGVKIFTDPKGKKRSERKGLDQIYISALDNIFWAMKDHRLFDRFGFNLPASSTFKIGKSTDLDQYNEWEFDLKKTDWINSENEQKLSGYLLTPELRMLLENNIDINTQ